MATTAAPTTATPVQSTRSADLARALATAVRGHIVAYKADDGYDVPSSANNGVEYHVSWPEGATLAYPTCTCPAGAHGRCCKHAAVAIFARKHGVHAVRPVKSAAPRQCLDCGQDAVRGFSLCQPCARARNDRWDAQDAAYHLPLSRLAS